MTTRNLEKLQESLSNHIDDIKLLFECPTKVTIVVRTPTLERGGAVIGDDSLDEVIAEIERQRKPDVFLPSNLPKEADDNRNS